MLLSSLVSKNSPDPLPDSTEQMSLSTMQLIDNTVSVGVEIELENLNLNWKRDYIPSERSRDNAWSRESDGSLRGPSGTQYEFKFATPLRGQKVNQAIERFYGDFETEDLTINSNLRTSMHIHVNMLNMDVDQLITTMLAGAVLDRYIFSTTGPSRPYTGYCKGAAAEIVEAVGNHAVRDQSRDAIPAFAQSRYYSLNAAALFKYGTLEFRHFSTPATKEIAIDHINSCLTVRKVGLEACEVMIRGNEEFSWADEDTCKNLYRAIAEQAAEAGVPQDEMMSIEEFSGHWRKGATLGTVGFGIQPDPDTEELLAHLAMDPPAPEQIRPTNSSRLSALNVTGDMVLSNGTVAGSSLKSVIMNAERLGLVTVNTHGVYVVGLWAYTLNASRDMVVLELGNSAS